jgi:hypothetical protein
MKLSNYLVERGITALGKWQLLVANSISPDGKIILGVGINPHGRAEGWIVRLQ